MTPPYTDQYFTNSSGLQQHYRLYAAEKAGAETLLCMPGLTRNARDFEPVADLLGGRITIIAVNQRGRGLSDYDPDPTRYAPQTYVEDMFSLLDHLELDQVHIFGTSLGGLMGMIMQGMKPSILKSAIINDIGCEIEEAGLERIKSYVGGTPAPLSGWDKAVSVTRAIAADVYPDYTDDQWSAFARRLFTEMDDGQVRLDYDPDISVNFKNASETAAPDLWPLWPAMHTVPTLILRGETSDILSAATLERMCEGHSGCTGVTIPRVAHTPDLYEAESQAAILAFADNYYNSAHV